MRLLLDTHVLLWWLVADPTLRPDARDAIAEAEADLVSAATVWEISVKRQIGKLEAPEDLQHQLQRHGFTVLPVHIEHAIQAGDLPVLHRDPFDRMLVAQAQVEGLRVVTRDTNIPRYEVETLSA